jgi:hypothetical protein
MAKVDKREVEAPMEPANVKKFICKRPRHRLRVVKYQKICKNC